MGHGWTYEWAGLEWDNMSPLLNAAQVETDYLLLCGQQVYSIADLFSFGSFWAGGSWKTRGSWNALKNMTSKLVVNLHVHSSLTWNDAGQNHAGQCQIALSAYQHFPRHFHLPLH